MMKEIVLDIVDSVWILGLLGLSYVGVLLIRLGNKLERLDPIKYGD